MLRVCDCKIYVYKHLEFLPHFEMDLQWYPRLSQEYLSPTVFIFNI